MITITDGEALSRVLDLPLCADLKQLLKDRVDQIGPEIFELGPIIIVQPGDGMQELQLELGFSLFENVVDGSIWPCPAFSPSWEWIAFHGFCFEIAFVFSDDGSGCLLFVQNSPMQNRELRRLCLTFCK